MMHGPLITLLQAEHRSRQEGPVPPPQELVWEPWVGRYLQVLWHGKMPLTPSDLAQERSVLPETCCSGIPVTASTGED